MGTQLPILKKGHSPPNFRPMSCGQTAGWIKVPLGMELSLGPDHMLDGDPATRPQKRGHSPQFLAHVYCGQTAEWIKMPLDIMEVGRGPGHILLDWDPAPPT